MDANCQFNIQDVPWKTINLFVSSTFIDMEAERDCLKKMVFPVLEQYYIQFRVNLNLIDLRWGVNTNNVEESEREKKVLKVCLNEIRRKPVVFIALLGGRYGWIPDDEIIEEFIGDSIAVNENVKGISITELEISQGALQHNDDLQNSIFYFRAEDSYQGMNAEELKTYTTAGIGAEMLQKLKHKISEYCNKEQYSHNVKYYTLKWGEGKFTGLEEFASQIQVHLIEVINHIISDDKIAFPKNDFEQELLNLDIFIQKNNKNFIGRERELNIFYNSIKEQCSKTILIAESGVGKSSLWAVLFNRIRNDVDQKVICLGYSTAMSSSSNIRSMLKLWCYQLCRTLNADYQESGVEILFDKDTMVTQQVISESKQINYFLQLLNDAKAENYKTIIFIDALNGFSDDIIKCLTVLPTWISFFSTSTTAFINGKPEVALTKFNIVNLQPFTKYEAGQLILELCKNNSKELHNSIYHQLLSVKYSDGKLACSSPLWIMLATTVLLTFDSDDFNQISLRAESRNEDKIEQYMLALIKSYPPNPDKLFLLLLSRAAKDFGENFVFDVFDLIAISKDGLPETDLAILLGQQWDELNFASMRRWFNYALHQLGNEYWTLTHDILRNAILTQISKKRHNEFKNRILDYFDIIPDESSIKMKYYIRYLNETQRYEDIVKYIIRLNDSLHFNINTYNEIADIMFCDKDQGIYQAMSLFRNQALSVFNVLFIIFDSNNFPNKVKNKYMHLLEELLTGQEKYIQQLAMVYCQIADSSVCFTDMITYYIKSLDCFPELINGEEYSYNVVFPASLPYAYSKLGIIYMNEQQYDKSFDCLASFEKIMLFLHNRDSTNSTHIRNLSLACMQIGDYYEAVGNKEQSERYYKQSALLSGELNDNEDIDIKSGSLFKLAERYYLNKEYNQALEYYLQAETFCITQYRENPNDENLRMLADAYHGIEMIYCINDTNDEFIDYATKELDCILNLTQYDARKHTFLLFRIGLGYRKNKNLKAMADYMYQALSHSKNWLSESNDNNEAVLKQIDIYSHLLEALFAIDGRMEEAIEMEEESYINIATRFLNLAKDDDVMSLEFFKRLGYACLNRSKIYANLYEDAEEEALELLSQAKTYFLYWQQCEPDNPLITEGLKDAFVLYKHIINRKK